MASMTSRTAIFQVNSTILDLDGVFILLGTAGAVRGYQLPRQVATDLFCCILINAYPFCGSCYSFRVFGPLRVFDHCVVFLQVVLQ